MSQRLVHPRDGPMHADTPHAPEIEPSRTDARNERIETMTIKPTQQQTNDLADRRMRGAGVMPPVFSKHSLEGDRKSRTAAFEKKQAQYRSDAELFLTRVYESEQAREDEAAAREQAAYDAQVDQLRSRYLAQPGTDEAGFQQALPRLLERQREDAALNGDAVFRQQVAEARRRIGSML